MIFKCLLVVLFVAFLTGCQTTQSRGSKENKGDIEGVLSAIAGALSGKTLSEEELRNLEKQIQTDEEAQTAIQSITDSVGGKASPVKYCPVTGRRYASHLEICPEHQVQLEVVSP